MKTQISISFILLFLLTVGFSPAPGKKSVLDVLLQSESLVAVWDFREEEGQPRKAKGMGDFPLEEADSKIMRIEEGPLSGYSALFKDSAYFRLSNEQTGALNIHGKSQGVTVMAWVKWEGGTGFVGGMWNEYTSGGKRQYGLFVNLPHYNGKDQVCGHISYTGKPTPPFPYSADYSASKQTLETGKWHFIAFTYDGTYIKSYLDGEFEEREPEKINNTAGFEGLPDGLIHSKNPYLFPDGIGDNGSDFTVGAVVLNNTMGNFFNGQIGGLAVFNEALDEDEIKDIDRYFSLKDRSELKFITLW